VGAVLFVGAVIAAIAIVALQPHVPGDEVGDSPVVEQVSGESPADPSAGAGAVETGAAEQAVLVHVVGEVRAPGVVELEPGARVQDAIEAAGGATEAAVLAGVNLARPVSDGEQIVVPDAEGAASPVAAPGGSDDPLAGVIDLNTADAAALESLPRVGPSLARRILDWREANGRFASVDQLLEVSGIGQKTLEGFRDRVRV
jgi:competence protein ComEA